MVSVVSPNPIVEPELRLVELCFALLEDAVVRSGARAKRASTIQFEVSSKPPVIWSFDLTRRGRVFEPVMIRRPALVLRVSPLGLLELWKKAPSERFDIQHCGDLDALGELVELLGSGFDPVSVRAK